MKNKIILLVLLFSLGSQLLAQYNVVKKLSQQNKLVYEIEFTAPISNINSDRKINYPEFSLNTDTGKPVLPSKNIYVIIPPFSKVNVSFTNQTYSVIENVIPQSAPEIIKVNDSLISYKQTELDESVFTSETYPEKEFEIVAYKWLKDFYVAEIKINTHRFNWRNKTINALIKSNVDIQIVGIKNYQQSSNRFDEIDKQISKLFLNSEDANKWRSVNPNVKSKFSSDSWIDFSKEYVKLGIIKDGIQRINYDDLISYGVNPQSVIPKSIEIFFNGNQIPLYVEGESDNQFNENDFVEFYAEKYYTGKDYTSIVPIGTDYINYMDRYNDTSYVWLTWEGNDGKRINIKNDINNSLQDTLFESKVKIHQEKDVRLWYYDAVTTRTNLPFWQEHKVWTWQFIGNSGSKIFAFNAYDFIPNSNVKITSRLISNAANVQVNAHKLGSSLNSTSPQDTIDFDYKKTMNFTTVFNSNNLISGKNNFRIFGLPSSASFHQTLIDWVDIEFQKYNKASKDSVLIIVPDTYSESEKIIKIANIKAIKDNILIYKISPSIKKIINFDLLNSVLTFSDTLNTNDKYLIVSKDFTQKPILYKKKMFNNVRSDNGGADYLIVSNRILSSSSIDYSNFISEHYELRTRLIFVDDIYDEFNYGNPSAECIKDFISFAYTNWTEPKPEYLLLLGDANYDYKDVLEPAPAIRKKNLVPSFGMPVSDVWFTTIDSLNTTMQMLLVGRIPANSNEEVYNYLEKHKRYISRNNDDWNKRYLLFSGGDPTKVSELAQIKATNDYITNELITPKPVGGYSKHFYKTINPPSNFGPVTKEEFQKEIDESSLFVSYIGHSGTQTWDNGITSVRDLKSKYNNRSPLITDFGCSTGRFAEPDVNAFSELFIAQSNDGQAINYLGNSSFGYLSTSLSFPKLFYKALLKDSITAIGNTHYFSKQLLFMNYGISDVNRVFNYCNLLFGDPIIEFALPKLPEYKFENVNLISQNPSDNQDSVTSSYILINNGKAIFDSVKTIITDDFNANEVFRKELIVPSPDYSKEYEIKIPVNKLSGIHELTFSVNPNHLIPEINPDDNISKYSFNVYSSSLRTLSEDKNYSIIDNKLTLLNPINQTENPGQISVELSRNPSFSNPLQLTKNLDTMITEFNLLSLKNQKRYWYRSKLNSDLDWSDAYSFYKSSDSLSWFADTVLSKNDYIFNKTKYDSLLNGISIDSISNKLKITSAGANEGKFASVIYNDNEKLLNTFFWGLATAIIDSITYEPNDIRYFVYPSNTSAPALIQYLQSLPQNTLVAFVICDDGAQSVLGFSAGTAVRNEIKNFGSDLIDQVKYRESWCMIGKKGAPTGTVPEVYKKIFDGMAIVERSNNSTADSGEVKFPSIKNSSKWISIVKNDSISNGSSIKYYLYGIKNNSEIDTLNEINFNNGVANIDSINAQIYPEIQVKAKLYANENKQSPILKSIAARFEPLPELAINSQVVKSNIDSLVQGEIFKTNFEVWNVSKSNADSVGIKAELFIKNSYKKNLLDTIVAKITAESKLKFFTKYKTSLADGYGDSKIKISIDTSDKIKELFEDNNIFEQKFYIIKDTVTSITSAEVKVYFDEREIANGDYVATKPEIRFDLNYQSMFPYDDSSAVRFYIDNKRIYYSSFKNIMYDTIKRNVTFVYIPDLSEGEHELRINGNEVIGNIEGQEGYYSQFNVSSESKLLYVYNYPNPFSNQTDFTFTLTQEPDEVLMRIYTVAGRLVKKIKINDAVINFNKISWDGKDEDGDLLANGIYLYKVMVKKNGKTNSTTQKLAILR